MYFRPSTAIIAARSLSGSITSVWERSTLILMTRIGSTPYMQWSSNVTMWLVLDSLPDGKYQLTTNQRFLPITSYNLRMWVSKTWFALIFQWRDLRNKLLVLLNIVVEMWVFVNLFQGCLNLLLTWNKYAIRPISMGSGEGDWYKIGKDKIVLLK